MTGPAIRNFSYGFLRNTFV